MVLITISSGCGVRASPMLFFMIVMYLSSEYTISLRKIKILSINMINSYIWGHTEDRKYPINACGVVEDMSGGKMTPELAQSCYLKLFSVNPHS